MENSLKTECETEELIDLKHENSAAKRRKVHQRTVVTVKIESTGLKQRNEGPPSDLWSWRKYGQKPIKGSPYPRGYYKCSTSKGCSAKKQVERCKTDASLLLITYTSSHNHPVSDLQNTTNLTRNQHKKPEIISIEQIPTSSHQEQKQEQEELPPPPQSSNLASEDHFHYLKSSPKDIINNSEDDPFIVDQLDNTHELLGFVFVEEPIFYPQIMNLSTPTKSEENDFFDELEELPTSSSLTNFMRSSILDERILLQPS